MKLKPDNSQQLISLLLLLLLGLLAIGLQLSFVGMYYDDFGNASLSYGYSVEGVAGTNYTIAQLLEWAKYCYLNWGGRVLYAVLFVIPLLKNGITAFMIVQTVIMIAICFTAARIICHYTDKKYSLSAILLLYIFYGLIGRDFHAHSTYWASASVLYLWPLLPLFIAVILYIKACGQIKQNQKPAYRWLLPGLTVLLFFAACSQEQVGLSVIVFFVFYIGIDHGKDWQRYRLLDGTALAASVISYLLLFLAPGNFARLGSSGEFSELSFFGKLSYNFPRVLQLLFMKNFMVFNVLLLFGTFLMVMYLYKRNKRWGITIGTTLFLTLIYAGMLAKIINLPGLFNSIFYFLFLVHFLVISIAYFCYTKRPQINALTMTAGASVFCLLYSPGIYERCTIEYLYIVFILLAILFIDGWERYSFYVLYKVGATTLLVLAGLLSVLNFGSIMKGYYENSFYNKFNHQRLLNYTEADGNIIYLAKLPNPYHHGEMPYEKGKDFIHAWYREYYDLPESVWFQWGALGVEQNLVVTGDFYEDGWFGRQGTVEVLNKEAGNLIFYYHLSGDNPQEEGLIISVNGNETTFLLEEESGYVEFALPETADEVIEVQVTALSTYHPSELSDSQDVRELSMILRISQ